ncbi:MAG: mechanosensitive ion channel [Bdellovibrionales bacterium]|nr:mechanosensitive ion channel [Bdellovibrionales bacterium]
MEAYKIKDFLVSSAQHYLPLLLGAFLVLIVGLWLIGRANLLIRLYFKKSKLDDTLEGFLSSFINIALKILLFISVAQMVGIQTTSFIALLGAAGLAVGMALQGSLSNFAGSVILLIFRPYKVGDTIETQGVLGTVKEIQMFCTVLRSPDNKTIIVPNGPLASGIIKNLSTEKTKRVDLTFGVSYEADIKKVKELLYEIIKSDSRVLEDPQPLVAVNELADSSVNFVCRPWVKTEDYWDYYFDTVEKVKVAFDKNNISIPYPHQELIIKQNLLKEISL